MLAVTDPEYVPEPGLMVGVATFCNTEYVTPATLLSVRKYGESLLNAFALSVTEEVKVSGPK